MMRITCAAALAFFYHAINSKAAVGANGGTRSAADACVGMDIVGVVVTAVVDLVGLQFKHVARTGHYTQAATFATFAVDFDRSINFRHRFKVRYDGLCKFSKEVPTSNDFNTL